MFALVAVVAHAHPTGFHKKLTFTLEERTLTALIILDVDAGERCLLLREAVDENRDGLLRGAEVEKLRERLLKMATSPLKLGLSGAPLAFTVRDVKLSLRNEVRANDAPLSLAVLIDVPLSSAPRTGMTLEVTDTSPDQSPVVVQVFQRAATFEKEVSSGVTTLVRVEAE